MRPRRLELEGFGAFRERTVVDFTDLELVALVGRTGSGKSTIIDAITFALFGSVARYDDKKVVAPVVNQMGTRARVQLDFELGDRCYTAVRLVQRRGTGATTKEARLERDGVVMAADAKGMTAEVERLLGLDADRFNRTVVLPQGRFADFLHDSPADRQETLRSLLGLGIYRTIATEARQLATVARTTADAWRPEVLAASAHLTDDHRADLVMRRDRIIAGRAEFVTLVEELVAVEVDSAAFETRLATLDSQLELLADVRAPVGLAELEEHRVAAEAALTEAASVVERARRRRRDADAAAAAGPDPILATAQRAMHQNAIDAVADHRAAATDLAAAEERTLSARAAAAIVEARRIELEAVAALTAEAETVARRELDTAVAPAQVDLWLSMHRRRDGLTAGIEAAVADLQRAAQDLVARRDVAERAGAAGYVGLLRVGESCPLCQQQVREIPGHLHADRQDDGDARLALAASEREHARLTAQLAADQRMLGDLDVDLSAVPPASDLVEARAALDERQRSFDRAAAAAREAADLARGHRERPEHVAIEREAREAEGAVAAARALEGSFRTRRERVEQELIGVPAAEEVERAISTAAELAAEQRDALAGLTAADAVLDRATEDRRATEAASAAMTAAARAARDRVAGLGPPALAPLADGPAAAWAVLTTWADTERSAAEAARAAVATQVEAIRERTRALAVGARDVARELLGTADGTREQLRDRLAQAETSAQAAVATFDAERVRIADLAARIDEQDERRHVADQLALHLRADRFEAWLMEAAVVGLVEAASERLHELTAGGFSLALVDNTFMVRDHANADELRSARTLSGGETFLASLALALALADATSELAPEGSPALESIFLDEGFGSLDPATLDVVAAAIEELGSAGRLVVVVTHVRELADRLPVRLEVVKTATTATVERVDT